MNKRLKRKKFHHRTAPGTPAGTLVADPSRLKTAMHVILYGEDEMKEFGVDAVDRIPVPAENQVLWLNVIGLADAEVVEAIGKRFHLHPLALEDVLHVHQRAKTEEYQDHLFIVARMLGSNGTLETEQVAFFLGANFVITFQERPGDCFNPIRSRIRQKSRLRERGSDYLAYALIDAIIDAYFPRLELIGSRLDDLDEAISGPLGRQVTERLHDLRRDLIQLRKLLWQQRESLNVLVRQEKQFISRETQLYLRDCLDHVVQLMDVSETDRETCLELQELHVSQIAQRTNDIMRILTLIATIFMPMSFVAGLYGMNFDAGVSPYNMPETRWYFGYPYALLLMAVLSVLMVASFWRRGWFRA
jgi:magnesium transporter